MPFLFNVLFEASTALWVLACLALGAGYAALLYQKKSELSRAQRRLLFLARMFAVAGIAFLLFAPLIKITTKSKERPIIILGHDNSASIAKALAPDFNLDHYLQEIRQLQSQLDEEFDLEFYQFGTDVNQDTSLSFDDKATDIASFFKRVTARYQNRNVGAIVLASDGIYNQGGNPQLHTASLKFPIYTIALGDTIPKKDILISNVRYNDIVHLNNQFQIEVDIEGYLSNGMTTKMTVSDESGVKASEVVRIASNNYQSTISLTLEATKKGVQRYEINIAPVSDELSKENNHRTIFVEVIDARKEIVLLANSPHPDLTALKQGIEENRNYEVKVVMADDAKASELSSASLLILHQLPSRGKPTPQIVAEVNKKPVLYVLGGQTDIQSFSAAQNSVGIASSGSLQEALGVLTPDFYAFNLTGPTKERIQRFAPLLAPYGTYTLKSPATIMLGQKIGTVQTERPLLVFGRDRDRKIGVLAGEGVWRWRLNDFEANGDHAAYNELIGKVVQYLSTNEDRRKFRVFSSKSTYEENEAVIFSAELYDENYELVNTPEVNITLKNKQGRSYSFLFSRSTNSYELNAGTLPGGEYIYEAHTALGASKHTVRGQFVVMPQQTEYVRTTADHQLLYAMSKESSGKMLYPGQLGDLLNLLKEDELVKVIVHEDERFEELIDVKYVFFVLMLLLTLEWFVRKREGEV